MKIAFLTPEYPHPITGSSGGIGTSIKNLAKALTLDGHTVRVLVYGQNKEAVFNDEAILVQQIKNVKIKGLSWYFTRKKIEKIINELYDAKQIELVEAPDWTGITSFIQPKNCPITIKLHGSDTYFCHLDQRSVKWLNRFHEKRALKNAAAHCSVSEYTAKLTNELFGLNKNFTIIPNAVDLELFSNSESVASNKPIILYFGTLIRKKGLLELPFIFNKVIAQIPDAELHLVGGDSPDISSGSHSTWALMQPLFTEQALKNTFYQGKKPYNEMQQQIVSSSVCVFPTFAEAFPVSWLEAMAMKKAIVASEIGWGPEAIEHNVSGFLVHPKNHALYAEKIVLLLKDTKLREEIGQKAFERVALKFDSETIALKNIEFYTSIIKLLNKKND
jgi:glycosyltransferase involved in cell wall biosynthesis